MTTTSIEWTDATWNPVRGCSQVSKGCTNCYAMKQAHRFSGPGKPYEGLTRLSGKGPVWTGHVRCVPELLDAPLRWRKPQRVFVNSMSDLFHDAVPFSFIDEVWATMLLAPRHTYQVLTKRPQRMSEYLSDPALYGRVLSAADRIRMRHHREELYRVAVSDPTNFPARFIWLGTSIEDQPAADERIPHLLRTPAAVRFLSCEPLLGPLELRVPLGIYSHRGKPCCVEKVGYHPTGYAGRDLNWVIVGGESGPGARPFALQWAESLIEQCKAAGVACFVKQLGARAYDHDTPEGGPTYALRDRKGGDIEEWPEHLRVREFPGVHA